MQKDGRKKENNVKTAEKQPEGVREKGRGGKGGGGRNT